MKTSQPKHDGPTVYDHGATTLSTSLVEVEAKFGNQKRFLSRSGFPIGLTKWKRIWRPESTQISGHQA